MLYQKGSLVVYGSSGVCRIDEIGPLNIAGRKKEEREYYTLSPLFGSGVIYTPVDTSVFMRPVLSKGQVEQLIQQIPFLDADTDSVSNTRALTEHCRTAFESHECEELLRLIRFLYCKEQKAQEQGRRLSLTEVKYRKHAEELVHGEFSVALGIPYDDVPAYISARLPQLERASS